MKLPRVLDYVITRGLDLAGAVLCLFIRIDVPCDIVITEEELRRDLGQCSRNPTRILVLETEGRYTEKEPKTFH